MLNCGPSVLPIQSSEILAPAGWGNRQPWLSGCLCPPWHSARKNTILNHPHSLPGCVFLILIVRAKVQCHQWQEVRRSKAPNVSAGRPWGTSDWFQVWYHALAHWEVEINGKGILNLSQFQFFQKMNTQVLRTRKHLHLYIGFRVQVKANLSKSRQWYTQTIFKTSPGYYKTISM